MKLSFAVRNFCPHKQHDYANLRTNDKYMRQRNTKVRANFSDNRMTVPRVPMKRQYIYLQHYCVSYPRDVHLPRIRASLSPDNLDSQHNYQYYQNFR